MLDVYGIQQEHNRRERERERERLGGGGGGGGREGGRKRRKFYFSKTLERANFRINVTTAYIFAHENV